MRWLRGPSSIKLIFGEKVHQVVDQKSSEVPKECADRQYMAGSIWMTGQQVPADGDALDFSLFSLTQTSIVTIESPCCIMDSGSLADEKSERRLYIGNLDLRITEAALIKMFSPFGKIVSEDFLWHTRGPNRGEPRGFAFIQFSTKEEAQLAKEKMNGRLACGRPMVVRLASEKCLVENAGNPARSVGEINKSGLLGGSSGQISRNAKIAAIKNKLKTMEEERCSLKKPRQGD